MLYVPTGLYSADYRAPGVMMQVWLGGVLRLRYQPAASVRPRTYCTGLHRPVTENEVQMTELQITK